MLQKAHLSAHMHVIIFQSTLKTDNSPSGPVTLPRTVPVRRADPLLHVQLQATAVHRDEIRKHPQPYTVYVDLHVGCVVVT